MPSQTTSLRPLTCMPILSTLNLSGNNSVWFPKAGLKISNEGMNDLSNGEKIQTSVESISSKSIQIGEVIGTGVSSNVCKGLYIPYNCPVAVKIVNVFDKEKRHQMINDLQTFLSGYDCRNLISFIGAYYEEGNLGTIKIVLEYMDQGSLRSVIKRVLAQGMKLSEQLLGTLCKEILSGLLYLHRTKHQLHRDVKPENILLDSSGQLKLTDFGISKELGKTYAITNTFVGTMLYMSPERMNNKNYSYSADIWALGIILFELAMGKHPYHRYNYRLQQLNRDKQTYIELIRTILQKPSPTLDGPEWSGEIHDFLRLCLEKEDSKRADAETLLKHPWIQKYAGDHQLIREWLLSLNLKSQ